MHVHMIACNPGLGIHRAVGFTTALCWLFWASRAQSLSHAISLPPIVGVAPGILVTANAVALRIYGSLSQISVELVVA